MSDFNELKRNNQSEDRLEAVYQKVDAEKKTAKKKPTVFATILATIKRDKDYFDRSDLESNPPALNSTIISFIVLFAFTLVLLLCYFFINKLILVPILVIYCPFIVPLILLVFNYEMNRDGAVKHLSVFISIMVGFVLYLIISLVNDRVLYNLSLYSNVESYVYPIIFTLSLFFLTFILASSFKATKLSAYILIAVTIALSYYYLHSVIELFSDLFVKIKVDQIDAQAIEAIIKDEQHLSESIEKIFDDWFKDYLFMPLMYSFWAIIIGSVVSVAAERRGQHRRLSRTTYLLLILVLFLQTIVYISTSIDLLDSTLNLFSFIISAYVSITMLNTSLSR